MAQRLLPPSTRIGGQVLIADSRSAIQSAAATAVATAVPALKTARRDPALPHCYSASRPFPLYRFVPTAPRVPYLQHASGYRSSSGLSMYPKNSRVSACAFPSPACRSIAIWHQHRPPLLGPLRPLHGSLVDSGRDPASQLAAAAGPLPACWPAAHTVVRSGLVPRRTDDDEGMSVYPLLAAEHREGEGGDGISAPRRRYIHCRRHRDHRAGAQGGGGGGDGTSAPRCHTATPNAHLVHFEIDEGRL